MTGLEIPMALWIAGGTMAAASTVSAIGAIRQGQAAKSAADFNAAIAQQNSEIAGGQSIAASEALQRDQARKIGSMTAGYAASGVQMSDGSPADVLGESARMATLDQLNLKYNYDLKKRGYNVEGELSRANGENSRTASYFNAMGSMLQGGSKVAGYFA